MEVVCGLWVKNSSKILALKHIAVVNYSGPCTGNTTNLRMLPYKCFKMLEYSA